MVVSVGVALGVSAGPASAAPPPPDADPLTGTAVSAPATLPEASSPTALPAGMRAQEQSAVAAVDGFWKRHFREVFGKTYRSPKVRGGYIGTNGPSCNNKPAIAFNAFYCRPGDFLAWDEQLMSAGFTQIGDSWVYLVIAHEWGHAIQNRVKGVETTKAVELQADCLAGATLQGAARDGLVRIEDGDDEELAKTLAAAADDFPWTDEGDHGDAQQRIGAFNTGAQKGVKACF
jgi:uncharacterized protein